VKLNIAGETKPINDAHQAGNIKEVYVLSIVQRCSIVATLGSKAVFHSNMAGLTLEADISFQSITAIS
jgi:hypothetical protein